MRTCENIYCINHLSNDACTVFGKAERCENQLMYYKDHCRSSICYVKPNGIECTKGVLLIRCNCAVYSKINKLE
jgi:hypothetical protein